MGINRRLYHMNLPISVAEAPMRKSLSLVSSNSECVKCVINKDGKQSCCSRGGTWFKNCGDPGDTKFDHTWVEGIQACKGDENSVLVESSLEIIAGALDTTQIQNATQQQTSILRTSSVFNAGSNSSVYIGIKKVIIYVCVMFVIQ